MGGAAGTGAARGDGTGRCPEGRTWMMAGRGSLAGANRAANSAAVLNAINVFVYVYCVCDFCVFDEEMYIVKRNNIGLV